MAKSLQQLIALAVGIDASVELPAATESNCYNDTLSIVGNELLYVTDQSVPRTYVLCGDYFSFDDEMDGPLLLFSSNVRVECEGCVFDGGDRQVAIGHMADLFELYYDLDVRGLAEYLGDVLPDEGPVENVVLSGIRFRGLRDDFKDNRIRDSDAQMPANIYVHDSVASATFRDCVVEDNEVSSAFIIGAPQPPVLSSRAQSRGEVYSFSASNDTIVREVVLESCLFRNNKGLVRRRGDYRWTSLISSVTTPAASNLLQITNTRFVANEFRGNWQSETYGSLLFDFAGSASLRQTCFLNNRVGLGLFIRSEPIQDVQNPDDPQFPCYDNIQNYEENTRKVVSDQDYAESYSSFVLYIQSHCEIFDAQTCMATNDTFPPLSAPTSAPTYSERTSAPSLSALETHVPTMTPIQTQVPTMTPLVTEVPTAPPPSSEPASLPTPFPAIGPTSLIGTYPQPSEMPSMSPTGGKTVTASPSLVPPDGLFTVVPSFPQKNSTSPPTSRVTVDSPLVLVAASVLSLSLLLLVVYFGGIFMLTLHKSEQGVTQIETESQDTEQWRQENEIKQNPSDVA